MARSREGAKVPIVGKQNQNQINVCEPTEIYCSLVIRLGIGGIYMMLIMANASKYLE